MKVGMYYKHNEYGDVYRYIGDKIVEIIEDSDNIWQGQKYAKITNTAIFFADFSPIPAYNSPLYKVMHKSE